LLKALAPRLLPLIEGSACAAAPAPNPAPTPTVQQAQR
jgi:hypothetical protein